MLCGFLPFDEDSKSLLYKKILACDYNLPSFLSPGAADLIRRILVRSTKTRFTIEDIKKHEWFKSGKGELKRGYVPLRDKPIVIPEVCKLAALKAKVEESMIRNMVEENCHNKYTTL